MNRLLFVIMSVAAICAAIAQTYLTTPIDITGDGKQTIIQPPPTKGDRPYITPVTSAVVLFECLSPTDAICGHMSRVP